MARLCHTYLLDSNEEDPLALGSGHYELKSRLQQRLPDIFAGHRQR